jgi:flagellar basal-body rod protein FlgB
VFNDVTTQALQLALAGLNTRQRVTANNIANTETPGFTATNVSFEDSLASALQGGDASSATISEDPTSDPAGTNGNNVDLAAQMVTASKTVLQEELITGAFTSQLGLLSSVLKV